ncbi:MAG TPA: right-handed parallel beta-helix repeat-containing protein, partial [Phycisphaeraceae bacterium]
LGSQQSIYFEVDGKMPAGGNVLVLAWSDSQKRMVDEFAHVQMGEPWRIYPSRMNMLPPGRVNLQLLLRVPGQDTVKVTRWIEMVSPQNGGNPGNGGDPGDGGTTEPGDGGDPSDPGDGGDPSDPGDGGDPSDPGDGGDPSDPGDGGSNPSIGWTPLSKSSDTRVIYVSSSQGDDDNDGLTENRPVRTLAKAYSLLRSGSPDWMLLKRGDTFDGGFPQWTKSGRSQDAPMVISTYGSGPRPLVRAGDAVPLRKKGNVANLWVIGVAIDGRGASSCMQFRGGFQNILLEDCYFANAKDNLEFQPVSDSDVTRDLSIRRCVIADARSTGSAHSQGAFIKDVEGLLIEECLFDHNGWSESVSSAEPTMFNHNIYLKECRDVVIRGNVLARGSSFGLKISSDRTGGMVNVLVEDNLFLGDANGITVGRSGRYADYATKNLTFRRNVFTELGRTLNGQPQAFGVHITSADGGVIERNYFIYKDYPAPHAALELDGDRPQRNIAVRNNVVYQWRVNNDGNPWRVTGSRFSNVTNSGNLIEPKASQLVDADRNVDRYAASQGGQANWEAFLTQARQQRRGNWRDGYTAKAVVDYIRSGFSLVPSFD